MDAWVLAQGVVAHDITRAPWPFPDASFDHVLASHVFEHIPTPRAGERDPIFTVLEECARVLSPGGLLEVHVPVAGTLSDFANPTHYRHFHERAFTYFEGQRDGECYHDAPLRLVSVQRRASPVTYRSPWLLELDTRPRFHGVPLAEHARIRAPWLFRAANRILRKRTEYRVLLRKVSL
jgi:SAM-dependent methyltransferase